MSEEILTNPTARLSKDIGQILFILLVKVNLKKRSYATGPGSQTSVFFVFVIYFYRDKYIFQKLV